MFRIVCWRIAWTGIVNAGLSLLNAGVAPPVMQVRVYNVAQVSPKDLAGAEQVASLISAKGGIATSWRDGSEDGKQELSMDFSANLGSCGEAPRAGEHLLQLVNKTPQITLPGSLGSALPPRWLSIDACIMCRCRLLWPSNPGRIKLPAGKNGSIATGNSLRHLGGYPVKGRRLHLPHKIVPHEGGDAKEQNGSARTLIMSDDGLLRFARK